MTLTRFIVRCWHIVLFVGVLALIHMCASCSPQKRLNRLLKNNPHLADTVYRTADVQIPGYSWDTTITHSTDTSGIAALLSAYRHQLDTLSRRKLTTEIHQFIAARPCIDAPVWLQLPDGGEITVAPVNGGLKLTKYQAPRKAQATVPGVVYNYTDPKPNWRHIALAVLIGWVLHALTTIALARLGRKAEGNG